jgi:hypothetical protein
MNKSQRLLVVLTAVVVVLTIIGAVSFVSYARRHAPNPRLVAVAPFDIFVTGLDPWRVRLAEGLTEQLSASPPLTAVPQAVVRERWRGADRPEIAAVELARRTSAGVAVYGRLDSIAGHSDSVRAQLIVIDASSTRVLFGIVRRWPAANLPGLAPALAAQVRENYRYPGD